MKKTCKLCWGMSAVLSIGILAMVYMFMIRGNVTESSDGRTAIILEQGERDLVLEEMRGFLEGVQTITQGLAENDMKSIAEAAKKIGMANAGGVPVALMAKLPLEFKTLGMATHKAFDALSMEAQDLGDAKTVLAQMAELMNNCTTCHSIYRIDPESDKK